MYPKKVLLYPKHTFLERCIHQALLYPKKSRTRAQARPLAMVTFSFCENVVSQLNVAPCVLPCADKHKLCMNPEGSCRQQGVASGPIGYKQRPASPPCRSYTVFCKLILLLAKPRHSHTSFPESTVPEITPDFARALLKKSSGGDSYCDGR